MEVARGALKEPVSARRIRRRIRLVVEERDG